jgi:crotonobetainyl-CoA:carnitine CoA-transferase CaiB-like acyl-CoA transferase
VWTSLAGMSALLQAAQLARAPGRAPAPRGGTDHPGPSADDRYHRVADGWVRVRGAVADPSWANRTRADVVASLTASGVPAAAAQTMRELVAVPAVAAADAFHHDPRPGREQWLTPGRHARFSRTERAGTLVAPALGEHTREVLSEAGIHDEEIERLVHSGVALAAERPPS